MIIGIAGKMGSGKDYIAINYIIPYLENVINEKTLQLCFADQLKNNIMVEYETSYNDLYVEKTNLSRGLLQYEGTENGRDRRGQDIWIKYLANWITIFKNRGIRHFVITDCRFENEIDFIKNNGGIVIKINAEMRNRDCLLREGANSNSSHRSESDLPDHYFDAIINNDYDADISIEIQKIKHLIFFIYR